MHQAWDSLQNMLLCLGFLRAHWNQYSSSFSWMPFCLGVWILHSNSSMKNLPPPRIPFFIVQRAYSFLALNKFQTAGTFSANLNVESGCSILSETFCFGKVRFCGTIVPILASNSSKNRTGLFRYSPAASQEPGQFRCRVYVENSVPILWNQFNASLSYNVESRGSAKTLKLYHNPHLHHYVHQNSVSDIL